MEPSKKNRIRISKLVEDWNMSAIFLFVSTKLVLFFYRICRYENKDGWRKTTEVHHRNDEAKYIGSLHNLAIKMQQAGSDEDVRKSVISTLGKAFTDVADLHFSLKWKKHACKRVAHEYADIMEVSFHPSGKIDALSFYPDLTRPGPSFLNNGTTKELLSALKEAYNQTYLIQDKKRSIRLYRKMKRSIYKLGDQYPKAETMLYVDRMISASWISFSLADAEGEARKEPHFFTHQKHAGFGLLNIHCKYSGDHKWLDIWMQFSHIGIDGRAAAKLQGKIYQAFGSYDAQLRFPDNFIFKDRYYLYKYPDRDVFHGCSFIDLQPLMQLKKNLYDKAGNILPVTLLIWALARHPLFKNVKFNIPVDIPSHGTKDRTVGFVFIKPDKFLKTDDGDRSFQEFAHSINDQIKGVRRRQNENYVFMQSAVMASHSTLESMMKYMSSGLYAFTGDTCITFMENIEYAIPSLSDNINSIIAISLIPKDDNTIACVAIRSKTDKAKEMLVALDDVVENIEEMANINIS